MKIWGSKRIKETILFAVYGAVFGYLIYYVASNGDIMDRIMHSSVRYVLLGMACTIIAMVLTAFLDVICAKVYGIRISAMESIGLTFISAAINLILPMQIGSAAKAVYFKKKSSLTYSKYIAIVSGTLAVNAVVSFIQLIFSFLVSAVRWDIDRIYIWMVLTGFVGMVMVLALGLRFQEFVLKIIPLKRYTLPILEGVYALLRDRRAVSLCFINTVMSAVIGGVRFFFIFLALGEEVDLLEGMLYYSIYAASSMMPVLPGNIGISEALMGVLNLIVKSDFKIGVTLVLFNRIYYYIVSISGALIAAIPIWKRYNRLEKKVEGIP